MKFPNKYLRNLKPYKLASHKIWQVTPAERDHVLKLDWNEATIPPTPSLSDYAERGIAETAFGLCRFAPRKHTVFCQFGRTS